MNAERPGRLPAGHRGAARMAGRRYCLLSDRFLADWPPRRYDRRLAMSFLSPRPVHAALRRAARPMRYRRSSLCRIHRQTRDHRRRHLKRGRRRWMRDRRRHHWTHDRRRHRPTRDHRRRQTPGRRRHRWTHDYHRRMLGRRQNSSRRCSRLRTRRRPWLAPTPARQAATSGPRSLLPEP